MAHATTAEEVANMVAPLANPAPFLMEFNQNELAIMYPVIPATHIVHFPLKEYSLANMSAIISKATNIAMGKSQGKLIGDKGCI